MIGTIRSIANVNDSTRQDRQREVITRLKFIGTFQPGEKIDVANLRIEPNTLFTPIKRLLFGESRDKTFHFLNVTIERSIEIIQVYVNSSQLADQKYCVNIIHDLMKAVVGLKNIQETYREDKMFACNIDILIESVDAKLTEIKQAYPEIRTIKPSVLHEEPNEPSASSLTTKSGPAPDVLVKSDSFKQDLSSTSK